jgi:hypothetical protein
MTIIIIIHTLAKDIGRTPFENKDLNDSYASLSYYCRLQGMQMYIASETWYDDGISAYGWMHDGNIWLKEEKIIPKLLFLKITPLNMSQYIEDANMHGIKIVNNPDLDSILNDKMKTYNLFPDISPLSILTDKNGIISTMNTLRKATLPDDLDTSQLFLKPLSLARGEGIRVLTDNPDIDGIGEGNYLLQPRIHTSKRFLSFEIVGNYDCRIVMHNSKIVHCYLRIADSVVTIVALGGHIVYIPLEQIPLNIQEAANIIDKKIREYGPRIYTIDFVIGKSGRLWLIEMNAQPGISWIGANDQEVRELKILHEHYSHHFKEFL